MTFLVPFSLALAVVVLPVSQDTSFLCPRAVLKKTRPASYLKQVPILIWLDSYPALGRPMDATCPSFFNTLKPLLTLLAHVSDPLNPRALGAASYASGTAMTTEACINFCASKSFVFAGTEYAVGVTALHSVKSC